ncbi:MAG: hypothetical protein WBA06_07425 [Candidatus Aquilonibacter sp.]
MLRHRLFLFLAVASAALIAACGGSGGGSSPLPGGASPASKTTGATVRVLIPKSSASSSSRKPAFISPNTATITISVYTVNGATPSPTSAPVSIAIATSPDCTTVSGGTSCTISVTVPVATAVVLQISSYDASGNLLGQGLIGPINTTLTTIPLQTVSIGGVPATLVLGPSGLSAGDDGLTHAIPFAVSAQDADGNTIIPPGTYPNPIALSISGDTNGALSLSTTTVASPGPSNGSSIVTLDYNSAVAITQATIKATSGTISASVPFAPIVFSPTSLPSLAVGGSMQTVTVSEAGYGGAFNVPGASSTTATVTCVPSNCTPASTGANVTIDVAPGSSADTETVSIIDANGGFANLPITVTQSGGGGELVAPSYSIYEYATQSGGKNYGITVGPDGQTLWFVDQVNYSLGAIANPGACNSSTCAYSEAPVPWQSAPPTDLLALTAASDGNLYVTDPGNGGSDLGNLFQASCTPSPASCSGTDYPYYDIVDDIAPYMTDVISGPDGNLYISYASDSDDNSGIAWQSIVGCCSYPYEIQVTGQPSAINMMTFDQTGQALWFTDQGNANVGFAAALPCEYTCNAIEQPSGSSYTNYGPEDDIAHRPLPGSVASRVHRGRGGPRPAFVPRRRRAQCCGTESSFDGPLQGIVSAPDGNIYVADSSGSIDQVSPSLWESCSGESCTFTAIGLPIAGASPQNLTIGRDGNVWFTDSTGYVGFVALNTCSSGTCKVYEYHAGGSPWGITSGPDGNIWFTDSSTNKIGKVAL